MYISTYERVSRQAERTPAGSKIGLNTHNFQTVTVDIVLLILTTFFVGLRLYSRKLQGLKYGAEDWSILGALFSTAISESRLQRYSKGALDTMQINYLPSKQNYPSY
ncbi:hypothetical protein EYC84_005831 [Monilinia fructicola]|uniref:Uncharacterized protein n=1 Tax=Monilinia fructicola TaxID=38448 RepID=A0A5M9JXT6_MONFR|nr:hypothetical protein EYC84_005831 [Monilinia fructicola]